MKKNSLAILMLFITSIINAQYSNNYSKNNYKSENSDLNKESELEKKKLFINSNLELDELRFNSFWKIFLENEDKKNRYNLAIFNIDKISSVNMTDSEADSLLLKLDSIKVEILDLDNSYTNDLRSVLTPVEIIKLHRIERNYEFAKQYRINKKSNQKNHQSRIKNKPNYSSSKKNIQQSKNFTQDGSNNSNRGINIQNLK
jgi:hypothetical protein